MKIKAILFGSIGTLVETSDIQREAFNTAFKLTGLTARIFQHEYDHLLGVDYTMKVSKLKRDMAFKKWRKKYGRTGLSLPL